MGSFVNAAHALRDAGAEPGGCLGIDPGAGGGIAYVWGDGKAYAWPMPEHDSDLWRLVSFLGSRYARYAMLEEVHSLPRDAPRAAFSFGIQFGRVRLALSAAGIPFDKVTPAKWQKAMRCLSKGNKNVTKGRALELFPALRVTHKIADSLLIAEYGRRLKEGGLS